MFAIRDESDEWSVDSVCNMHILKTEKLLDEIQPHVVRVKVGNGKYIYSTHRGTFTLPTTDITMTALLCPNTIQPLISMHKLTKNGFTVIFKDTDGKIVKNTIKINLTKKYRF
jgi:hypothetical protein